MNWPIVFVIVAAAFAGYSLIESRGKGLLGWAVLLLALSQLWPLL